MRVFSKDDIRGIVERVHKENLDVSVGKGDNTRIVVKSGLKIKHKQSGLTYTVIEILMGDEGSFKISCSRAGRGIIIPSSDFKDYERQ